ncbi:Oidioi.mRNA.OKI2018_I69.XSR.g16647.t1.cds [Oikopleura dioica]|uniref:Oidioi.mRNA.OKI2018_I69.XSR.g16647.t1.cds n=1 Tax=Oikopleura dioica TaxID=34765 RepID=A0ABN7SGT8_OIKDI|nr:Oidioi.mRNA.OKI2018_I69.XSR.g16647.t1.cds [Oikopleura dioica]
MKDKQICIAIGVGGCGSDQLSVRERFVGSCCDKAAYSLPAENKYEIVCIVNRIYEEARKYEGVAEEKVEDAKKKVATAKKALEDAETEENKAREELEKNRNWRKRVQKRSLILTENAMKEENSDLDSSDESDETNGEEENEKPKCKVCFELFGNDHPEAVLITCGHKGCFGCLSSLPQKTCPFCRADFTEDKILKVISP